MPTADEMTNALPTNLCATPAASQSIFIIAQLYSSCDKWGLKNKQLTLLSQRELAFTAINTLFAL
jgi:hypothetical protein